MATKSKAPTNKKQISMPSGMYLNHPGLPNVGKRHSVVKSATTKKLPC